MPEILSETALVRKHLDAQRRESKTIALVPTMGALHEGHLSLVRLAAEKADHTVVSIFVNPTQFGPGEDFEKYPRRLEDDAALLETAGADTVFAPEISGMYADDFSTWVTVDGLTEGLCGASRPIHFRGVATVVTKLFNIIRPDIAVFGRKDAQQLAVIRRMVRDLDMGIEIIGAEIIREADGLAMSSRNSYLNADERTQAAVLYKSLCLAKKLVDDGETSAAAIINEVTSLIRTAPAAEIEYCEIVGTDNIKEKSMVADGTMMALAVRFGTTRLIDNIILAG